MRTIIKVAMLTFLMGIATAAFGQNQASEVGTTGIVARMHDPGVTPDVMVVASGTSDSYASVGPRFLPWAEAVALGKERRQELHYPPSLGEVARRYREEKASSSK